MELIMESDDDSVPKQAVTKHEQAATKHEQAETKIRHKAEAIALSVQNEVDDRTKKIVFGYIRTIHKLLDKNFFNIIPEIISNYCLSYIYFHFMFSVGFYEWIIPNNILKQHEPQHYECTDNPVNIANLKWDLRLNSKNITLSLATMPTSWVSAAFRCSIYCKQNGSKLTLIFKHKNYVPNDDISEDDYYGGYRFKEMDICSVLGALLFRHPQQCSRQSISSRSKRNEIEWYDEDDEVDSSNSVRRIDNIYEDDNDNDNDNEDQVDNSSSNEKIITEEEDNNEELMMLKEQMMKNMYGDTQDNKYNNDNEIKNEYSLLNFNICVNILRIMISDNDKNKQKHFKLSNSTKPFYEFTPGVKFKNNETGNIKLKWKINEDFMNKMKLKPSFAYENESSYNDMFCVRFIPKNNKQCIDVILQLKYLPIGMEAMNIKWEVLIPELNINKMNQNVFAYDSIQDLGIATCHGYDSGDISEINKTFKQFAELKQMNININILIDDMIDFNGYGIVDRKWMNFGNIILETQNKKQLKEWFENIKLEEYFDLFISNQVTNLEILQILNMDILNEMGIKNIGHKIKILYQIEKLKQENKVNSTNITVKQEAPEKSKVPDGYSGYY